MRHGGLLTLLLAAALYLGAETVQIGTGSVVNQSLTVEAFRSYSYSQQLYRADEINTAGLISSLSFQYSVASPDFLASNAAWQVWLGHAVQDSLSNWVPGDNLSLVYDGLLSPDDFDGALPGQGWLSLDLATPFFYDGAANLVIAVDENSPLGGYTADEFFCSSDPGVRGIVFTSNDINPDPAAPPPPPAPGFFYARNAFPNLRLEITPYSLPPWHPQPADQATGVPVDTSLQWQSNASTFELLFGPDPQSLSTVAQGLTEPQWNFPEPLALLTSYYWQVLAQEAGETYHGPVWSFTTAGEGIGPPQNLSAYFSTDHIQLNWEAPATGVPSHYRVIRNGVFLATTPDLQYQDYEVAPGQLHYYYLLAENHLGELSGPSNTVSVHIPDLIPNLILQEGFEACPAFSQTVPGWLNLDLDGAASPVWNGYSIPGLGEALAWLVFNPQQTNPPLAAISAHGGAQLLASVAAFPPANNDWLISPSLQLGVNPQLSFWARSHTADYGLERLRVLISTSGADPASFIALHTGNWLLVPDEWTVYIFNLAAWQGQSARLAFNCVSWDAQALYLDDVVITGEDGYVPLQEEVSTTQDYRVSPNPCRGEFRIASPSKTPFSLSLYDLRGRRVFAAEGLAGFNSADHSLRLAAGVYLLRLEGHGGVQLRRLAVIK